MPRVAIIMPAKLARAVSVLAAIILLTTGLRPGYAQNAITLDVDEFWTRLEQSRRLTEQALEQNETARSSTLLRLDALWTDVQAVRLTNEQIMSVDVSWLRVRTESTETDLYLLGDRITALLRFQRERYGSWTNESFLAVLDEVLQDDRFHYKEGQPATNDESSFSSSSESSSSSDLFTPSLAQIILMVIGIMAVALFASYLLQTLQVQPATADTNGDEDDVPPTSDAAQDRAEDAMTSGDYRAAIRYLYLASLLLLDERGVIRFDPSLTNTEHLRQITGQTPVRGLLENIVTIFDRVWYGFAPVDDRLYRHFQQLIDQLQQATRPS